MKTIKTTSLVIALIVTSSALPLEAGQTPGPPPTSENTWYGYQALFNDATGDDNSAYGFQALYSNVDGFGNTATGAYSLWSNTANFNTATGYFSLYNNTTGIQNTADGYLSLLNNTTGSQNTATGFFALEFNQTGPANTADGYRALRANTTGDGNTGVGAFALQLSNTGISNTGIGGAALSRNTTGSGNTALGVNAVNRNQTGNYNTGLGFGTFFPGGTTTFTSGDYNTAVGAFAGQAFRSGSDNIYIGNEGVANESDTIRIGGVITGFAPHGPQTATYIAGIFGSSTDLTGMPVYVDGNGKLGTLPSSARFKEDVKPMNTASEEIFSLKPVTFRYKQEVTKDSSPQFGLVAEDVAKVDPTLVVRDGKGQIQSVRYEAVNAMVLNELIKEHQKVQDQQKQIDKLTAQLKEQASMLQKVSAQVDLMKATPRTVADTR